jgi:hypothetical protein
MRIRRNCSPTPELPQGHPRCWRRESAAILFDHIAVRVQYHAAVEGVAKPITEDRTKVGESFAGLPVVVANSTLNGRPLLDARQFFEAFRESEELNLAFGHRHHPGVRPILGHNPDEWFESPPFTFLLFENGFLVFVPMHRLGLK